MKTRSPDGTTIETLESGSGPPLLLVHGTSGDASRWPMVAPAFAEHFTVHAMNRRGRGGSDDAGRPYALEREGEDIAAVIEALGEPTLLLAHSYGATCSLEALLRTDKVARAIFYEPPLPTAPVYPPGLADRLDAHLTAGDRDAAVSRFFTEVFALGERELAAMRRFPSWQGRLEAAHTLPREIRATDAWRWDAARFAHVDVPARIFVGTKSHPIAQEVTERLAAGLRNSAIVRLEGQQHIAMDTAPALFVRETLAFYRQSSESSV